ncbi:MAG: hypothetical protein GY861_10695 [bacterium]|nr:hypothetical protein [bacterium]
MVTKRIQGTTYTITKAPAGSGKKLEAKYTNKSTGKTNTIRFGATGYESYKDSTGLLPKSSIHGDPERRKRYIDRHRANENWSKPSAGLLAKSILW